MERITSAANAAVRSVKALRQRKVREETGMFFVEGLRFSTEALQSGWQVRRIYVTDAFLQRREQQRLLEPFFDRCVAVSETIMQDLSETEHPQGILTVLSVPERKIPSRARRVVLLDGLQDPGNMGTLIRTADAFAFDGVLACPGCVDPYNGKVLRATMGSLFHIPVVQTTGSAKETVEQLQTAGFSVLASHLQGVPLPELPPPGREDRIGLIIGNEGRGIAPETAAAADRLVRIPMPGEAESLNAAVAAGILLYTYAGEKAAGSFCSKNNKQS